MVFVESPWFTRFVGDFASDDALRRLQVELIRDPQAGKVIRGLSGLRKIRWALPGRGKRSGARAIYYYWTTEDRIYLLFAYAKGAQGELTAAQRARLAKALREEIEHEG